MVVICLFARRWPSSVFPRGDGRSQSIREEIFVIGLFARRGKKDQDDQDDEEDQMWTIRVMGIVNVDQDDDDDQRARDFSYE